jgi:hypothetical protein
MDDPSIVQEVLAGGFLIEVSSNPDNAVAYALWRDISTHNYANGLFIEAATTNIGLISQYPLILGIGIQEAADFDESSAFSDFLKRDGFVCNRLCSNGRRPCYHED